MMMGLGSVIIAYFLLNIFFLIYYRDKETTNTQIVLYTLFGSVIVFTRIAVEGLRVSTNYDFIVESLVRGVPPIILLDDEGSIDEYSVRYYREKYQRSGLYSRTLLRIFDYRTDYKFNITKYHESKVK